MKEVILEIIDYLRYEVANDKCTPEQLRSIYKMSAENLKLQATSEDLADFYGQSLTNVKNVLHRNFIPKESKPTRRVFYDFVWFTSIIPKSWRKK